MKIARTWLPAVAAVLALAGLVRGAAPTTQPAPVTIALASVVQDHQKLIQATATREGKPVAGLTLNFGVRRWFGTMILGHDQTYDDGTAYMPFPGDLPGGPQGRLDVIVQVTAPAADVGASGQALFGGAAVVPMVPEPFPRTLWAPRPPVLLVGVIALILAVVWVIYAYVVLQLFLLRKGTPA
jgi:hypothetical protein